MHCRTVHKYLVGYLDGSIPEELLVKIREHLSTCPHCNQEVTEQVAIRDALQSIPSPVRSEQFWMSLEQAVAIRLSYKRKEVRKSIRSYPIFFERPRLAFGGLAIALLLIILSIFWNGGSLWEKSMHSAKAAPNGEEVEFYLEEHDLTQGGTAFTQSAFAGVVIGSDHLTKSGKSK